MKHSLRNLPLEEEFIEVKQKVPHPSAKENKKQELYEGNINKITKIRDP